MGKVKRYKRIILILTVVFLFFFIDFFIAYQTGRAIFNLGVYDHLGLLSVLLKTIISAVCATGVVHAGLFIYNFTKSRPGQSGCLIGILSVFFFVPVCAAGIVTLIPYYIYCIIRYVQLKKKYRLYDDENSQGIADAASLFFRNFNERRGKEIIPYVNKYKQTIWLFWGLIILIFAVELALPSILDIEAYWLIPFIAAQIGLYIVMVKQKNKRMSEIVKLMAEKCDPEIVAVIFHEIQKHETSAFFRCFYWLIMCNAFTSLGMAPEAKSRLFAIDIKKASRATKVCYCSAVSSCCIALKDQYNVQQMRQQLSIMQTDKRYRKYKNLALSEIKHIDAHMYLSQGDYISSRALYEELIQTPSLFNKVSLTLNLAMLDLAEGKTDEAKSKLEYVVQNGNTMNAVQLARNELLKIQNT